MMAGKKNNYYKRRKESIYLSCVDLLVCGIGFNATSLIDVGSHNCAYLDWWPWIEDRVSLDMRQPFKSPGTRSIDADFFEWSPDKRYDVATCLQVLEHVERPADFARKLLEVADHVIVSVPLDWPRGVKGHVQDPVDEEKFLSWFPQKPNYTMVAQEPFVRKYSKRLIAHFDSDNPKNDDVKALRKKAGLRRNRRSAGKLPEPEDS